MAALHPPFLSNRKERYVMYRPEHYFLFILSASMIVSAASISSNIVQ